MLTNVSLICMKSVVYTFKKNQTLQTKLKRLFCALGMLEIFNLKWFETYFALKIPLEQILFLKFSNSSPEYKQSNRV